MNISHEESTYALLVRSEEKQRSFLEILIYTLCVASVVAAIYQVAHQPMSTPGAQDPNCIACVAPVHPADVSHI